VCVRERVYVCVCLYVCVRACGLSVYMCAHTHMCVCVYTDFIDVCVCACVCARVQCLWMCVWEGRGSEDGLVWGCESKCRIRVFVNVCA